MFRRAAAALSVALLLAGCGSSAGHAAPTSAATVGVDVACSSQSLADVLKQSRQQGTPAITGRAHLTGVYKTVDGVTYAEVSGEIERTIAGSAAPAEAVTAYVVGGPNGKVITSPTSTAQSAWAADGEFFGLLDKHSEPQPTLRSLPVVDGQVTFAPVGCWNPVGITRASVPAKVVIIEGGRAAAIEAASPSVWLRFRPGRRPHGGRSELDPR